MWPYVRQQHSSSDWHWWCPKSPSALQQVIKQAYTLLDHVYVIKMFPGVLRIGIPLNVVLNFPLSHYSLHLYVNSFQNWALRWKCPGSCFPYKRPFPQYMSFLIHLSCPWPRIKNFKFWNSNEVVASLLQANVCFIFKMLPAFLGFRFQYRSELLFHKSSNLLFCSWDQSQQNSGVAVKYPPAQRVHLVPGTKVGLWKSLFFSSSHAIILNPIHTVTKHPQNPPACLIHPASPSPLHLCGVSLTGCWGVCSIHWYASRGRGGAPARLTLWTWRVRGLVTGGGLCALTALRWVNVHSALGPGWRHVPRSDFTRFKRGSLSCFIWGRGASCWEMFQQAFWVQAVWTTFRAAVASLFGTRDGFRGRQFSHRLGRGRAWFGDDSSASHLLHTLFLI